LRVKSLIKTGRLALSQNAYAAQRIGDGECEQLVITQQHLALLGAGRSRPSAVLYLSNFSANAASQPSFSVAGFGANRRFLAFASIGDRDW